MLDLLHSFSFASQNVISLDSSDNWSWLGFPSYTLWTPNSFLCCGTLLPGSVRLHKALQPEQNSFISIHFLISCMQPSGMYIYILWIILASTMIHASHSKRSDPFFNSQYIKLRHSIQIPRIARCYLFSTIFSMLQFPRGQIRHLQHLSIHKTTAFNPTFQDNKMWSYSFH